MNVFAIKCYEPFLRNTDLTTVGYNSDKNMNIKLYDTETVSLPQRAAEVPIDPAIEEPVNENDDIALALAASRKSSKLKCFVRRDILLTRHSVTSGWYRVIVIVEIFGLDTCRFYSAFIDLLIGEN